MATYVCVCVSRPTLRSSRLLSPRPARDVRSSLYLYLFLYLYLYLYLYLHLYLYLYLYLHLFV